MQKMVSQGPTRGRVLYSGVFVYYEGFLLDDCVVKFELQFLLVLVYFPTTNRKNTYVKIWKLFPSAKFMKKVILKPQAITLTPRNNPVAPPISAIRAVNGYAIDSELIKSFWSSSTIVNEYFLCPGNLKSSASVYYFRCNLSYFSPYFITYLYWSMMVWMTFAW